MRVPSLVREGRSHMPCGQEAKTKTNKRKEAIMYQFNRLFKKIMVHIKKKKKQEGSLGEDGYMYM